MVKVGAVVGSHGSPFRGGGAERKVLAKLDDMMRTEPRAAHTHAASAMASPSQHFVHVNESDAAPWVRTLLEHLGLSVSAAAEVVDAALLTTTGALRTLRDKPTEWATFLGATSSRCGGHRYTSRNRL